jgi:diguanylate cyclase (GGDEF)-like protein
MKLPIRITVTGLFLILSTLIMITVLYVETNFGKDLAKNAMNDYFKFITQKIEKKIDNVNGVSNTIIHTNSLHLKDITYEEFYKNEKKYFKIFTSQLEKTPELYSMYIGFNDNRFYEIIKLNIDNNLRKKYNATLNDEWLLVEIDSTLNKKLSLFDKSLNRTSFIIEKTDYKVSSRPWYKASINSSKITKIGPYDFSNISSRGLTYSVQIGNENIFAIDVLTSNFNKILNSQEVNSSFESMIISDDFKTILSSAKNQSLDKSFLESLDKQDLLTMVQGLKILNGKEYLYNISKLNTTYDNKEYLISYVLFDDMIAPFMDKFKKIDQIMILIFLIILPIIWYFASVIVKPILLLAEESEKVEKREFDKVVPVKGFVYEIDLLSKSVFNMAKSINVYQTDLEKIVEERTKELEEKNNELEILSITDKLTNIYNRIMLDKTLDEKIESAQGKDSKFGVIIIDIDYFKMVNDTYGHQTGDMTLVSFAKILTNNIGENDLLGRWGGEEFVIICADSTLDDILSLSENLRQKVESYDFEVIGTKTASFGVSIYTQNDTVKSLVGRADEALYKAKDNGRNRVEFLALK